ncbi:MAG TPA: hypothetical protein VEX13_08615 [Chloroflexia bacterium]|nr:hypothetical protein [Chloroflexia bacterium]
MRKMKSYVRGLFVLCVVLGGVMIAITLAGRPAAVAPATAYQPSADLTATPAVSVPTDTPEDPNKPATVRQLPTGGEAIKPTIDNPGAGMPAFTTADVERYITAAGTDLYLGRRIHIASPPKISKIEFLTERDLKLRPGATSSGLSDDALLCYVELNGSFKLNNPMGPVETFHTGVIVFNAQTGNIMAAGARP